MKKRQWFGMVLSGVLLVGCASSGEGISLESWKQVTEAETGTELETAVTLTETEPAASETGTCFVYVCGAVVNPGVYELPAGSRIYEALELAGGMTEDGVPTAVNLVEVVYDGQQIQIPTQEEFDAGWQNPETDDGLVNLNTATKQELMTLSGIGESKAEAIIAYREEHGDFGAIEELMEVSGIKEAAFEKVKDYITVD